MYCRGLLKLIDKAHKWVCFIQHALHMLSLGLPLLSPFSWAMKMATTKANQETTVQGMLDETGPLINLVTQGPLQAR